MLVSADEKCLDMHVIQSVPIGYVGTDNQVVGVQSDYLALIEQYSGICINKILMPYARIWQSIEKGDHDGGIVFRSSDRDHLVEYVARLQVEKTGVIAGKKFVIKRYEDLYGLVIGKTRAAHLNDRFDIDKQLILVDVTSYEQAAKMFSFNRIDAMAGSLIMLKYQLSILEGTEYIIDKSNVFELGTREQWLQLSKHSKYSKHLKYTQKLKDAVAIMIKNGDIKRVNQKYSYE